ncbi:MAG TPA: tRNA lysidine(34) synthetase TilS [Candidatus Ozemobacteraceae bacterium]|nr:tRNA lysidine(34) synthetase TilS [Candidatus Ozemobacteraceae bacterium]
MAILSGKAFETLPRPWRRWLADEAAHLPGTRLGVAVSGGGDSVALLRLLLPLQESGCCSLTVIHVDHGWRPESASEADWVRILAEAHGLPFRGVTLAAARDEAGPFPSEAAARAGRLAAFARIACEERLDAVALGHTADDQAETVLMRLLRGTSLQGLAGIRPRSRLVIDGAPLRLWRPLLGHARSDLRTLLETLDQRWLEDPSNDSPRFLRNRIRAELLPLLERLRPGMIGRICDLAADLGAAATFVGARARRSARTGSSDGIAPPSRASGFLLREILRHWLIGRVGIAEPGRAMLARLADLVRSDRCGRSVVIAGRTIARTHGGLVVLPPPAQAPAPADLVLEPGRSVEAGKWAFDIEANIDSTIHDALWFDPGRFPGPILLRTRRPGDRFRPAGGAGGKKLARWLIDRHIPRHQRDELLLIASGSDILWILDLGIAEGVVQHPVPGWLRLCRRRKSP